MKFNYAVIVVTYNRLELLKECLEHINNQTVKPTKVIVIDNCSTDGTKEYLDINYTDASQYLIVHLGENTGGAGGFNKGLTIAMDTTAEWFMLIDDDAILDYDCMEHMMPKKNTKQYAAYACSVVTEGNIDCSHRRNFTGSISEQEYHKSEFECQLATFCGLMINRFLVEKIGYPEADFFIWFDDTEYCMRIDKYTGIIVRTKAKLNHKTKPASFHGKQFRANWKNYYGTRNNIYSLKKHKKWLLLLKTIRRTIVAIIKLFRAGHNDEKCIAEAHLFMDAVRDGLSGRLGRNEKYLP